ncbi:1,2-phenylacetyl-CoA epoxidase subunit PaaC [Cupriavidus taiwanensis]|uniref:1,2-phenylacetyl-CoA epoxidase subunit PaaC n=1 Tax=Cupriavidus taiwanensis TaxID=164546 RepID=UPI000E10E19E|nr:1,2-phenylacetyl-CoA epoxidase subunit PaaC [Cupriavidus taiwanensis]SOY52580.1 subunit of multicomponent oxygenase, phenylacetic acid degradation [Cupriavidus taiwanensis]SOY52749.1 subunit of multicomponent oxygenase, phenylacetic acid degradation [Cupriavidus taiwanensis]SOY85572.1 subunit of multicomponent oxygenase, phenylacetic acid degradation [Cupriavidus taiwanensis]SOZ60099.1 subunit of multicomponent oxygenase, phenylacetic acid degradation [Cupriavidus taiwanensis]SOZ80470.1 sub
MIASPQPAVPASLDHLPPARTAALRYVLRLADNALILGQRNAEWCGHGPVLEEDIALANISLDLIGQARLLYGRAGELEAELTGLPRHEDDYAYWRAEREFRNWTLLELPHRGPLSGNAAAERDYAVTIVRNFLYSALMVELWQALQASRDEQLAAIAAKAIKEARYHLHHAAGWVVRLGDGTEASHARMQGALEHLLPYMNECFAEDAVEIDAAAQGIGVVSATLRPAWDATVAETLEAATLTLPAATGFVSAGKHGVHSEHMSYLLGEMQGLARAHPGAQW